jgi:hypothetical protein
MCSAFSSKTYLERALTPMQGFSEGVEVTNLKLRVYEAFSYYFMRPEATSVWGLELLVYAALSY